MAGRGRGHPSWCARDHTCTAGRLPGGEHRSEPMVWRTGYGTLIATRTQKPGGASNLDIRLVAGLHPRDEVAGVQVQALLTAVDAAVRSTLAGPPPDPQGAMPR